MKIRKKMKDIAEQNNKQQSSIEISDSEIEIPESP
jgi:hypothetical protein